MSSNVATQASLPTDESPVGGDLRLTLACPQCGTQGWVALGRLRKGLRCPRCECHFLLGHNGRLQTEADLPHVRFDCPRCKQTGRIPKFYALKKVECGSCRLPMEVGPDRQLHGAREAIELRRQAAAHSGGPARQPLGEQVMAMLFTDNRQLRKANAAIAMLVFLVAATLAVASIRYFLADPVEREVRHFTYTCLAGDRRAAENYLEDSDVARAELQRWRSYYFNSILDAHRPPGDHVTIAVEPVSQNEQSRVFLVSLQSNFLGERQHRQHWRKFDDDWRFDVLATLREIDGP